MGILKKSVALYLAVLLQFIGARFILLLLYSNLFHSLTAGEKILALLEGIRFDLASISVLFCIPFLLMNVPFRFSTHKIWSGVLSWSTFFICIGCVGFLTADLVYFDFVKRHISHELFMMGGDDMGTVIGLSISVFAPALITFLAITGFNIFLWEKINQIKLYDFHTIGPRIGRFAGLFIALLIAGRGGFGMKPIAVIDAFSSGKTMYGNLVLNGVFSASHSLLKAKDVKHRFYPNDEALKEVATIAQVSDSDYPVQKELEQRQQPAYNLVFVLIESLSYKYVDFFANKRLGITPNLDKLAEEGLAFTNFYASGQRSVEGIQVTLTGVPTIIGMPTIGTGMLANTSRLGEMAQKNGYSTLFVQSLKRQSFRGESIAGAAGFQNYYGMEDMPVLLDYPDPTAARYGWDYETYMLAFEKMNSFKNSFISYVITSTTHTPYPEFPPELMLYPHSINKENGFLNTVNYTDWSIGEFMKKARKTDWFDNTIFIFTADHALAHYQSGDYLEKFKVPLIIYAPKIFKPQKIDTVASQLDLFDTIVDALNWQGRYSSLGTSLLRKKKENAYAITREGSIMGIISEKGYLRHTLSNRLETGSFIERNSKKPLPSSYFDSLEKKLLSFDQVSANLLQTNKWRE